jgi:hypothetical protein
MCGQKGVILVSSLTLSFALIYGQTELRGGRPLAGMVLDEQGRPVRSARVVLLRVLSESGALLAQPGRLVPSTVETSTDKNGLWSCDDLESGTWQITVSKDGYSTASMGTVVSQACVGPRLVLWIERLKGEAYEMAFAVLGEPAARFHGKKGPYDIFMTHRFSGVIE